MDFFLIQSWPTPFQPTADRIQLKCLPHPWPPMSLQNLPIASKIQWTPGLGLEKSGIATWMVEVYGKFLGVYIIYIYINYIYM